jgi:hypothetical protein
MPRFASIARSNMLALFAAYARATGLTTEQVSKRMYGNMAFYKEFKAKTRTVSIDKYGQMLDLFASQWPKETPWPGLQELTITTPKK